MSGQNKYKRLGVNSIYTFIGNVEPQLVSFLLVPFYTYWLTREDYGIQDLVLTCIVFFIPYLSLGFYEAVFLFPKDKEHQEQKEYFSTAVITVSMIMGGLLLLWFVVRIFINDKMMPEAMLPYEFYLVAALVIGPYQRIIQNFARSLNEMKVYSITGVVYAIVMLVLSLTLVPKCGLSGYFVAFLSAELLSIIYAFWGLRTWTFLSVKDCHYSRFVEMIKYSLPLVPNATMWWVVNSINRPIMLATVGLGGVGLYAVANKFPSIINVLFTVFFSALQISVLEEFGKKDYSIFYNNVFRVVYLAMILVTFLFFLCGDLIFKLIISEEFQEGVIYVPILCVGALIANVGAYVGSTFNVLKKTKYFLYSTIIAAIVAVVANWLLIPSYGIMGACIAICLSQLAMFLYRWFKSYKYVNFEKQSRLAIITLLFFTSLFIYYMFDASALKQIFLIALLLAICACNLDMAKSVKEIYIARRTRNDFPTGEEK